MSIKNDEIINAISKMSVLELLDLIKEIEKVFGVTSVNFQKLDSDKNVSKEDSNKSAEKTVFSVFMTSYGDDKLNIIKKVRAVLNLGLKEAKDFVESLPALLKKDVSKIDAENVKKEFESLGAKIDIK